MDIKKDGVQLQNIAEKIKVRNAYDETLDSVSFSQITKTDLDLKVGSWYEVEGYPYILESFVETPYLSGARRYNYNLLEGIVYFQSIIMSNLTFSQRSGRNKYQYFTPYARYGEQTTIYDVLNRLAYVCVTQMTHSPTPQFEVVADKALDVIAPEFFFNDSTLFDALVEIGEYIGYFPRLEYNDLGEPKRVRYIKIDKPSKNPVVVNHAPVVESHSISEYANTFRIVGDNLITTENDNSSYPTEISTNSVAEVVEMVSVNAPYDSVSITGSNSRITVSQPIYKIKRVDIFFYTGAINGRVVPKTISSGFGEGKDSPVVNWCVDFKTWMSLPPAFTISGMGITLTPRGKFRESTMYYNIGERDILNVENMLKREFPISVVMDDDTPFGDPVVYFDEPYIRNINVGFRVTYVPMSKNFLVIKKNDGEIDWIKSETLSGAFVDVSRASRYADRQIKGALSRNYDYSVITKGEIEPGATVDNRFINIVNKTIYNGGKRIQLSTLSEYNRKSAMIEVNRKPNPFEISTDRVSERILHTIKTVKASSGTTISNEWLKLALLNTLALKSYNTPEYIIFKFIRYDLSSDRIAMTINKTPFSGSVVYKVETYDNVIAGVSKVTEYDLPILRTVVVNQRGIVYTDVNGEVFRGEIQLCRGAIENMTRTEYKTNYPLLESDETPSIIMMEDDIFLDKDNREKIIFTLQFDFKDIKFTDYGLSKSPFIIPREAGSKRIAFYSRELDIDDENIRMNDNDPFGTTTFTPTISTSSVILTLDSTILNNYDYKSFAVYDETSRMIYYKNEHGTIFNAITINVSQ
jgi:hypothetical protein